MTSEAFLTLPPFPRRKLYRFELCGEEMPPLDDEELDALADQLADARIGGRWWGAQPQLGSQPFVLTRPRNAGSGTTSRVHWADGKAADISDECDPWHVLGGARELHCAAGDPVLLIAGLSDVPVALDGGPTQRIERPRLRAMLRAALGPRLYRNPFSGQPMPWSRLVALCAQWRELIDANRSFAAVYGFASWKRATTEPLLWDGSRAERFNRRVDTLAPGDKVAIWKSRTPAARLAELKRAGVQLVEAEDGFIRSAGLGANCVPPQSIVVDLEGIYFDPRSPSTLETLIQRGQFSPQALARAEALQERIAALGVSKYGSGHELLDRRSDRQHILVPGQVEDDRAVLSSIGPPLTNLDLIRQVRTVRPDAYLLYKPHPDVEAGHRKGAVPDAIALQFADEVVRNGSIASWIDLADAVHVNSSLAGFEALMRGKPVTTHGVPFYAGWGLTEDLGPVPSRRSALRSLTELVAAALILYPRYVDPITNLPCPPEIVIDRLGEGIGQSDDSYRPLVLVRRLQGWLQRLLQQSIAKP